MEVQQPDTPYPAPSGPAANRSKAPDVIPDIETFLEREVIWWPLWVTQAYIHRKTRKWLTIDHIRHLGVGGAFIYGRREGREENAPFPDTPVHRETLQRWVGTGERVSPLPGKRGRCKPYRRMAR